MSSTATQPMLAESTTQMGDQLQVQIQRLIRLVRPQSDLLERKFGAYLRRTHRDPRLCEALAQITPAAAARILKRNTHSLMFFDQVAEAGRRLAKLNVSPQAIVDALQRFDALLVQALRKTSGDEHQWIREQLHFCTVLTLNEAYYQVREAETQAFHEIFSLELESRNLEILLRRFVESMARLLGASAGHMYFLGTDGRRCVLRASTAQAVSERTRSAFSLPANTRRYLSNIRQISGPDVAKYALDPGWAGQQKSVWSIPLKNFGVLAGVMQLAFCEKREWLPRDEELVTAAVERCMMAAERARLVEDVAQREQQIRELAEHMLQVEEMERRRIGRELHDEAGQSLICIRLQLELLEMSLPPGSEVAVKLTESRDLTERTILEIRRLIADLSPAVLEQFGLEAAIRQFVKRFQGIHQIKVRLNTRRLRRLPQRLEIVTYRIVQECFNNVSKHSMASNVNICVSSADGLVRLLVEDDGVGFHVESALLKKDSFGLSGIRERVALLGGTFVIESLPATAGKKIKGQTAGTSIRIELPIPLEANW